MTTIIEFKARSAGTCHALDVHDPQFLGLGLRLAVLGQLDNSPLPEALHAALCDAARRGIVVAQTLLAWRDQRLLEAIETMEGKNGAQ